MEEVLGDPGVSSPKQLPVQDENENPDSSDMNTAQSQDEDDDADDTTDDNFNCDLVDTNSSPLIPQEEEEDHIKNNDNKNSLSNSHSHGGLDDIGIDMDVDTDENWDLGSPLLPQPQRFRSRRNNSDDGCTSARENEYLSGVSGGEDASQMQIYPTALLDPFHFYMTISSSASLMLFIGLVVGSFYFPWSDTMMRISFRTILSSASGTSSSMDSLNEILETLTDGADAGSEVVGGKLEFDLPLYSNATFRSTLDIFQSSHSNMLVGMILLTTVAAPAIWMMLQLVMVLKCHFIGLGVFRAKRSGYVSQSQHELYTSFEDEQEDIYLLHETMERYNTYLKFPLFLAKYSMAITYVNAILLVCTSNVRFALGGDYSPGMDSDDGESSSYSNIDEDNTDGMFLFAQVVNDTRGGLISYLVGLTLGVTAFMVLRKQLSHASAAIYVEHLNMTARSDSNNNTIHDGRNTNDDNINPNNINMSGIDGVSSHSLKSETLTIQSPPPIAFKMVPQREDNSSDLNLNKRENEHDGNIDETEFMFGSLDLSEPLITSRSNREGEEAREEAKYDNEFEHSPQDSVEALSHRPQFEIPSAQNEVSTKQPEISRDSSWTWFELFLFEGGLMSFLLLPPLLSEPLIQLKYTGILTPVLDESAYAFNATSLAFSTIIRTILTKSGSGLFPFVASGLLLVNIIVIPFISWICCSITFIVSTLSREEKSRHDTFVTRVMRIPKTLHPLSNITPFAISIIVTVMSLEQVSNFLFNENRACEVMAKLMAVDDDHEQCMIITGTLQPMVFVLLIQACAMDYYITLF